jgi:hypothetical protein
MDKVEKTKRARQIGRMTYEQVRPLFDEISKQHDERRRCPDCHYQRGANWHYCDVRKALVAANKGRITSTVLAELRAHNETCTDCFIHYSGTCLRAW